MMPLESSVKGSLFFKDKDGEYSEIKGVSEISETSEAIESFDLINSKKNFFVTGFDLYSLKRGLEIFSEIGRNCNVRFCKIIR